MDQFITKRGRNGTARLTYRREPWDSEMLGLDAYRICGLEGNGALYGGLLAAFVRRFGRRSCYAVARLPARDTAGALVFQAAGFHLVNSLLEFEKAVGKAPGLPRGVEPCRAEDEREVLEVMKDILTYSRFRFQDDPCLPKKSADKAVLEWARNCCSGQRGDLALVKRVKGRVAGLIVCQEFKKERRGNIDLLAVSRKFQGKAFGKELVAGAFAWFAGRGLKRVSVATSLSNPQAANFYAAAGFRLTGSKLTLGYYA
ncbi:MAG: hypothetical protein A2X35_01110 [Elusimicrobia bacterium GWA2_61_42]|nr:MAG: hypothetical protein A2X35_01110 [Elusimicrobia bacterium GWA2_61_42]OGR75187.1 MAG: hypothetical protein A2X38_04675 [Elusimicrobia bacterium GWC2_61_25]